MRDLFALIKFLAGKFYTSDATIQIVITYGLENQMTLSAQFVISHTPQGNRNSQLMLMPKTAFKHFSHVWISKLSFYVYWFLYSHPTA